MYGYIYIGSDRYYTRYRVDTIQPRERLMDNVEAVEWIWQVWQRTWADMILSKMKRHRSWTTLVSLRWRKWGRNEMEWAWAFMSFPWRSTGWDTPKSKNHNSTTPFTLHIEHKQTHTYMTLYSIFFQCIPLQKAVACMILHTWITKQTHAHASSLMSVGNIFLRKLAVF